MLLRGPRMRRLARMPRVRAGLGPNAAAFGAPRGGPATAACATTGVICGGRTATGAFCNAAGGTCTTAGATGAALAKTRCGTTVANRRLAKFAFATCGGGAPCDSLIDDGVDVFDVGDVDVADIGGVAGIARPVHLARRQRKPADRRPRSRRLGDPGRGQSDKGDECGRIDRLRDVAARDPAPAVVDIGPASIMKRSEAPRLLVDPGPAPRRNPYPAAVAIGRPIRRRLARIPHLAILRAALPVAVGIEVGIAGHLRRDIVRRGEAIFLVVVRGAPLDEGVGAGALGADRRPGSSGSALRRRRYGCRDRRRRRQSARCRQRPRRAPPDPGCRR